jgi:hypothetical protein
VRTKVFLFTLRLSSSGRAVHKAFGTQGQEAFLDGHQHAFTELGGYAGVDPTFGASSARRWEQSSTGSADVVDTVPFAFARSGW